MGSVQLVNKQGIFTGDIYVLNYYGIFVFFQIARTTYNSVYIYEIESKPYKDGFRLVLPTKSSKNPFIVTKNNTYKKTTYQVFPIEMDGVYTLPIEVKLFSPLYEKAIKETPYPSDGIAYAVPLKEFRNIYYTNQVEIKNIKKLC